MSLGAECRAAWVRPACKVLAEKGRLHEHDRAARQDRHRLLTELA